MRRLLFTLGLLASVPAAAMDIDKDIFRADVLGADLQPAWTTTVNDLLADTTFDGTGSRAYALDDAAGKLEAALRIFPASGGGYWLTGWHGGGSSGMYLAIARVKPDGNLDASWGSGGRRTIATAMVSVFDVAKGANDTFYFVGTRHTGANTDLDIEIDCVDDDGAPCSAFGTSGVKSVWLDVGLDAQNKDDIPHRIVWFGSQLYVVGETDTGAGVLKNRAAFAIHLNPTTGVQDTAFGNFPARPGLFLYNPDHTPRGRDVANDVLAYSPSPFAYRLVLVGETQVQAGDADSDGFTLSLNGVTGVADGFINDRVFGDLGAKKQDKLTHVMRRRNGGFVAAGVATNDSTDPPQFELLMGAYRADGSLDTAFGGGSNMRHSLVLSGRNVPYGLAERADTRDLVVGLNINDDLFGDGHPMQAVVQFGRNGAPLHAVSILDFAANATADKGSWGEALYLDDANRVLTAGWRCWKTGPVGPLTLCVDEDMTAGRFVANDTIFASHFGRADSD